MSEKILSLPGESPEKNIEQLAEWVYTLISQKKEQQSIKAKQIKRIKKLLF